MNELRAGSVARVVYSPGTMVSHLHGGPSATYTAAVVNGALGIALAMAAIQSGFGSTYGASPFRRRVEPKPRRLS